MNSGIIMVAIGVLFLGIALIIQLWQSRVIDKRKLKAIGSILAFFATVFSTPTLKDLALFVISSPDVLVYLSAALLFSLLVSSLFHFTQHRKIKSLQNEVDKFYKGNSVCYEALEETDDCFIAPTLTQLETFPQVLYLYDSEIEQLRDTAVREAKNPDHVRARIKAIQADIRGHMKNSIRMDLRTFLMTVENTLTNYNKSLQPHISFAKSIARENTETRVRRSVLLSVKNLNRLRN